MRFPTGVLVAIATLALSACNEIAEPVSVDAIQVTPTEVTLELGTNIAITAVALDGAGAPIPNRRFTWASNNPRIVTVTGDGELWAVGAGSTTVTAESGGESATITVSVTARFGRITGGYGHTCGVTLSGRVTCWGTNAYGELGDSTLFTSAVPVLVTSDSTLSAVTAGGTQTCAMNPGGQAVCWGANWSAQLGIGTIDRAPHPGPASVAGEMLFASIETGDRHACGLTDAGAAYCWGGGLSGQLGNGEQTFICPAIDEPCNTVPELVLGTVAFRMLSAGAEHTCALDLNGAAYCWGENAFGQLGDSSRTWSTSPVRVVGGYTFTTITAGGAHTCALDAQGTAFCWGGDPFGQLGTGTDTSLVVTAPMPVDGGLEFQQIDAGGIHTCGLDTQGVAYCWGDNGFGQLGTGSTTGADQPVPVVTNLRFNSITTGWTHTCALATDGAAYCWGRNTSGQLGIGVPFGIRTTPTKLVGQDG